MRVRRRQIHKSLIWLKNWCCQTGLNCRPLHYQWSALPLSYGSMPGIQGIGPKRPLQAAGSCHKAPSGASARRGREGAKTVKKQRRPRASGRSGSRSPRPVPERRGMARESCLQFDQFAGVVAFDAIDGLRSHSARLRQSAIAPMPDETQYARQRTHTRQAHDEGCQGFARGAAEAGATRKPQAAKVAGARAQRRGGGIFRTGGRVPR
jgi:hypothetical protein